MRPQLTLITCVVLVLACVSQSAAQDKPSVPKKAARKPNQEAAKPIQGAAKPKPVDRLILAVTIINAKYAGRVVKGAPYSATAITESTQTLADANQIAQKKEVAYYRDREGRIRIEPRLGTIGKSPAVEPEQIVIISDPVAGSSYNLDPRNKVAVKSSPYYRDKKLQDELAHIPSDATLEPPLKEEWSGRIKHESLPKKTFELVEAEGNRMTVTIPAGEIGNKLPIEIVDESWYSPDLRAIVMTRHSDPRSGEVIWRLTNINRGEPDPSLFRVPADYKIQELYRTKYSPTPSRRLRRKQAAPPRQSKDVP